MDGKRLYRSSKDSVIGGVAGGLGEYLGYDPTLIRLLFVLLAFITAFMPIVVVYLILWAVVPKDSSAPKQPDGNTAL